MEAVRFLVFLSCSPTSTMIGDEVLNGRAFLTIIEKLEDKIDDLEARLNQQPPAGETSTVDTEATTETTTDTEDTTEGTIDVEEAFEEEVKSVWSFLKRVVNQKAL